MKKIINIIDTLNSIATAEAFLKLGIDLNDVQTFEVIGDVDLSTFANYLFIFDEEEGYIPLTSIEGEEGRETLTLRAHGWFGETSYFIFKDELDVRPMEAVMEEGEEPIRFLAIYIKE